VWYSAKQGTTHRPTSHMAHSYAAPFLWPREHRRLGSWLDDFDGLYLLLRLSSRKTFFIPSQMSAIRISIMTSTLNLIFFHGHCIDTYNGLPYLHSSVWLGTIAVTQCRQGRNVSYLHSSVWFGTVAVTQCRQGRNVSYLHSSVWLGTIAVTQCRQGRNVSHLHSSVWLGTVAVTQCRYERLLKWQQNRSKATMWLV
jgi:hypothetical protein